VGPGEYFGEIALLERAPRSATVVADTELLALRLYRRALVDVIRSDPGVANSLLAEVARRLRESKDAPV